MPLNVDIRPARKADIPRLVELLRAGAGGVIDAVYCTEVDREAASRETQINAAVTKRFKRLGTVTSFEVCSVAEYRGEVVGHLIAFPTDRAQDDPPDLSLPSERLVYWQPLKEMRSPGSYYVSSLAVGRDFRGKGVGSQLLRIARSQAETCTLSRLSLHVFEANRGAVKLYERHGFKAVDRRPAVPHELIRYRGDFLLMTCEL